MRRIILSSVPPETPLPEALESIHPKTRALVVARPAGDSNVVTAGDIMEEINRALDSGRDPASVHVDKVVPKARPTKASPVSFPPDVDLPPNLNFAEQNIDPFLLVDTITTAERNFFESAFKADDQRYVVQHLGPDWAIVVTASELGARKLCTNLTICTCVGEPKHTFEPGQLVEPGKCNKPHAVKVNCKP
jgi:hypothetical protein